MNEYVIVNGELYHHGVKGMKWGQNIFGKKNSGSGRKKKQKLSYEQQVRNRMKEYHKANPQRSKKDNYTIALRKEQRDLGKKAAISMIAAMGLMPIGGVSIAIASGINYQTRNIKIQELMDEYNIQGSKRVLNM